MAIVAQAGTSSRDFTPAPSGVHQAVCCDVVDLGMVQGNFGEKHKIRVMWQIDEAMDDGRPFIVAKRYTLSLHEKATLRKDLESWRGKAFAENEVASGFDVERLIGANCLINVVHTPKGDKVYADVTAVMQLKKGMTKMAVHPDYVRVKDRQGGHGGGKTRTSDQAVPG